MAEKKQTSWRIFERILDEIESQSKKEDRPVPSIVNEVLGKHFLGDDWYEKVEEKGEGNVSIQN